MPRVCRLLGTVCLLHSWRDKRRQVPHNKRHLAPHRQLHPGLSNSHHLGLHIAHHRVLHTWHRQVLRTLVPRVPHMLRRQDPHTLAHLALHSKHRPETLSKNHLLLRQRPAQFAYSCSQKWRWRKEALVAPSEISLYASFVDCAFKQENFVFGPIQFFLKHHSIQLNTLLMRKNRKLSRQTTLDTVNPICGNC